MADGVRIAHWDTACEVMAMLANIHRRKGKTPFRSSQFHPFRPRHRQTQAEFFSALSLIVDPTTKDQKP